VPSRSRRASVLVFDVNETLLDIESIAPLFVDLFGDRRVLREWFGQLVMYSMAAAMSENYVDFFSLGRGVLLMLADVHHVPVTDEDTLRLKNAMLAMPAHPDAAEGLQRLRDDGFRLISLTNSPPEPGARSPLESAGLAGYFEAQLSVDSCRTFKPAPAVYRHVCDVLGVDPVDCMMVAAHVWDLLGASNAGFGTALIARPGNPPLPVAALPQPDIVVSDLLGLTERLATDSH
jgi:2-haloacid dehalogenase